MSYLSPTLTLLANAVKKATAFLDRDFNEIERLQSSVRGSQSFAEKSYNKTSQNLFFELGKIKPGCAILENRLPLEKGPCFLVNPIDGAINFARGIPLFATTVVYCENGEAKACVIYNRANDELFFAEKGNGAYKDGFRNYERLRVSSVKDAAIALCGFDCGYEKGSEEYNSALNKVIKATANIRINGCISLSMANVAAAKLDLCAGFKSNLSSIIAGLLLVREAGGYIYDLDKKILAPQKIEEILASENLAAANANMRDLVKEIA